MNRDRRTLTVEARVGSTLELHIWDMTYAEDIATRAPGSDAEEFARVLESMIDLGGSYTLAQITTLLRAERDFGIMGRGHNGGE